MGDIFILLFKAIVPLKLRMRYASFEEGIESWLKAKREKIKEKSGRLIAEAKQKFNEVKSVDYKAKAQNLSIQALAWKSKLTKAIKESTPKVFLAFLFSQLLIPIQKSKAAISSLSPNKFLLGLTSLTVFGLACLNIYFEGRKIVHHSTASRAPASVEIGEEELSAEGLPARRAYYKKEIKQMLFTHVKMPVYFKDINELHSLDIDFSLQANNRYTIKFLDKYEHELRDHILMTIEPIVPEFPLEEEGKDIIKEKIEYEVNTFLRNNDIDGYIEEVKVVDILGT